MEAFEKHCFHGKWLVTIKSKRSLSARMFKFDGKYITFNFKRDGVEYFYEIARIS